CADPPLPRNEVNTESITFVMIELFLCLNLSRPPTSPPSFGNLLIRLNSQSGSAIQSASINANTVPLAILLPIFLFLLGNPVEAEITSYLLQFLFGTIFFNRWALTIVSSDESSSTYMISK